MNRELQKQKHVPLEWLLQVDRILRGEATGPTNLQGADIKIPIVGISFIVILMAIVYGFCMGIFSLVRGVENNEYHQALLQTLASMAKVPLLFCLTLLVTFPSLYVFNALVGSRLRIVQVLKLLLASLVVNLAVLASMGPILAFFSVSTPNYQFIVLLNVALFTIAGVLGLAFLIQTLNRLSLAEIGELPVDVPSNPESGRPGTTINDGSGPANLASLDTVPGVVMGRHVKRVFGIWILVFGLVGAQMGWVLRPFIGAPGSPFTMFRSRSSNFFEAVLNTFFGLF